MGLRKSILKKIVYPIPEYIPVKKADPPKSIDVVSAWQGLEQIIPDIMDRFGIQGGRCIEIGVEFGYSAVIFSNFFQEVVAVDTFEGDIHSGHKENHYESTKRLLQAYPNINLEKCTYQEWIVKDHSHYNFAHVDIVHTYDDTFTCGLWAAERSQCAIFHDTESFMAVRHAVIDIAKQTGKQLFNYPYHNGLGIIAG